AAPRRLGPARRGSGGHGLCRGTCYRRCPNVDSWLRRAGVFLRRKFRRHGRSELPLEPVWAFYPKYWFETVSKQVRWISMYLRLRMIYLGIKKDPNRHAYMDQALTPVSDDDTETLEMFNNAGAQAFVSQKKRLD